MGIRRSRPKALAVILIPTGDWRLLYSFRSTACITDLTIAGVKPNSIISRNGTESDLARHKLAIHPRQVG